MSKGFWIIFLSLNVISLVIAYLVINEIINKETAAIIVLGALFVFGFVVLIWQAIESIRFSKALKAYREELPDLIKAGLVDPDKIINAKFPDIW